MAKVLIVDDDKDMCKALRAFLEAERHQSIIVSNAQDALEKVKEEHPDLVFMDVRMPGTDGVEALKQIRESDPTAYVVIMTAYGTSQTSIEAIRSGAFDYINKPFDLDDIRALIDKALVARTLSRQATQDTTAWDHSSLVDLVGDSSRMREIYKLIGLLTTNDVPALITGERGVGKQLVARTIHFNSSRKACPFITVNSEVLPAEAVELEVFGRPAAGNSPAYPGRLERANGGTLFIDEIQHWPPTAQNRLLTHLKEKSFEHSGSVEVSADVRIIAASSSDLAHKVPAGFSSELYDALRLITIEIPPLRDRREDIPALVMHFIRRHNKELHKNIRNIDDRGIALLQDYTWPGNVAELENVFKRACILSRGDAITVDDVKNAFQSGTSPASEKVQTALEAAAREALQLRVIDVETPAVGSVFHEIVGRVETVLVREALRITGGNQVKAAEILGLNRATLRKKMNPEAEG